MKTIARILIQILIRFVYMAYGAEGLNALLLIMPAKLIAPNLRNHGAKIGQDIEIHSPLIIHNANPNAHRHYTNLKIGNDCYFGRDILFDLKDEVRIEDRVTVSMRVSFITHTDVGRSNLHKYLEPTHEPIYVASDAYIGAGVTILQGIEIGEGAIIGAGALVNKSIPPYCHAVGVPARVIKIFDLGKLKGHV